MIFCRLEPFELLASYKAIVVFKLLALLMSDEYITHKTALGMGATTWQMETPAENGFRSC